MGAQLLRALTVARFFTAFAAQTPGATPPAGWTPRWDTGANTWTALSDALFEDGIGVRRTATSSLRGLLQWDAVPDTAIAEIVVRWKHTISSTERRICAVRAGIGGSADGYVAYAEGTNNFRITRYVAGIGTIVAQITQANIAPVDTWLWVRLRAEGTTISAKIWADGTTEPSAWTISGTDLQFATGFVGLAARQSTGISYYDRVGVGTAGDTAPMAMPVYSVPRWDLTVYDAAGVPLLSSMITVDGVAVYEPTVSTAADHPRPWLDWPEGAGSEVDFLNGKAKIGQYNVTVQDKRSTATDQKTGRITALLGPNQGLNGLRNKLSYTDAASATVVAIDGPMSGVQLHESYAGYGWSIKDENIRTRKVRAFDRSGTTCVFPRGPVSDYGLLPSGKYAVPAAGVVRASYVSQTATQGYVNVASGIMLRAASLGWSHVATDPYRVLTQAMQDAAVFSWDEAVRDYVLRHCTVRWRLVGGAWHTLVKMTQPKATGGGIFRLMDFAHPLFETVKTRLKVHDTSGKEREYPDTEIIHKVRMTGADLPADGASVEIQVIYTGPATKAYPVHFDGTAGGFLAKCYLGDYSTRPLGVRYNAAAVALFTTPCTARITEPTDDLLAWLEKNWYQPQASAPTLNAAGEISPRRFLLPDSGTALLTLDDTAVAPEPDWSHPDDGVINEVEFIYFRDILVDVRDDPTGQLAAGDGVWAREIRIERLENLTGDGPSHVRFGAQKHSIKTELFRALGNPDGTSASGEATAEVGHVLGIERGAQALDRYLYGAPIFPARTRRSVTGAKVLGDWVQCGQTWLPDYISGIRGMNRVAQIVGIDDSDPVTRVLMLEDGGDAVAPLAQPTVGVAVANATGGVTLPVTAVVAGTQAVVEYAISAAAPAADSDLWTPAGRLSAPGSVDTPPHPAGSSVWIGARSVAAGRRPSLRTAPVQVVLATQSRVTLAEVHVSAAGVVTVSWVPNAYALGVRIYYAVAATEVTPAVTTFVDASAAVGYLVLAGVVALPGELVTVDVEPYTGWTGAAVSGTAGPKARAYGGLGVGPVLKSLTLTHTPTGTLNITVAPSANVARLKGWIREGSSPVVAGVPDDQYLIMDQDADTPSLSIPIVNGTYYVAVRGFVDDGARGAYYQLTGSIVVSGVTGGGGGGGGGGAITAVPGTPWLALANMVGPDRNVTASWEMTSSSLQTQVSWEGTATATDTVAAGVEQATRAFAIGSQIIARARYTDGALFGPWSAYSDEITVS